MISADDYERSLTENNYTFVALINLYDPPRPGVIDAVKKCHQGGVKIIVFSGDHPLTVKSISEEVEIISSKNPIAITGDKLSAIKSEEKAKAFKGKTQTKKRCKSKRRRTKKRSKKRSKKRTKKRSKKRSKKRTKKRNRGC